jgi:hypothetical protein
VLACLIVLSAALPAHKQFLNFMEHHKKQYKSDEEFLYRLSVFQTNLKRYDEWNSNSTPDAAWFGVTKFSDLTDEEFREMYLMKDLPPYEPTGEFLKVDMNLKAPTTFDWRTKGACTPIKDQVNVDLAGLSLLLKTLNLFGKLLDMDYLSLLLNKLLIVTKIVMVVVVVGHTEL